MRTSGEGISLIKKFELYVGDPYKDCIGIWTIGYGHVVQKTEHFNHLSEPEASALLMRDLAPREQSVARLITAPLTQGMFDALVSFAFNLGSGAIQASTLRRMLNRGDYPGAAEQFDRWVYAGGKKLKGLIYRRAAERVLFLS